MRPTLPGAFKVLNVMNDQIRLQLQPEKTWVPAAFSLKGGPADAKIPLEVSIIDSGAGPITLSPPVVVGYIVQDREGVVCDDSCEFAFDGVCDDGSEPNDEYYYQNYFNYMDDDMGGFYYEGEEGGEDGGEEYAEGEGEDAQYGVAYDDYYMENEEYQVGV